MVQEFHLSITPVRSDEYLVRVEWMEPGVPLAEEQVHWPVDEWLAQARQVFTEPLAEFANRDSSPDTAAAGGGNGAGESRDGNSGSESYKVITLNPLEAEEALASSNVGTAIAPEPALVKLGQELYNALFQGTIRDAWVMAQGVAQNHEQPLRLRLGMKGDRLQRLPWEVLHAANRPLAASTDIVFSRYHSSFSTVAPAQRHQLSEPLLPPALQILMVLSAPTDQANLELKREAMQLQQELGSHRSSDRPNQHPHIELTLLEQPGREALTQVLEQAHYQVFHFAGHSSPGASGGKLQLVNADTGLTESLNGDDLAGLLVNNGIKLAVFNSCSGTQAATSDEFDLTGERTLAEALIHRGIPSVLAMAERIPDQVALNLSRLFYRNLKFGHPLDVSLCRARQGLISSYGSNQLYWALPILYLQTNFEGRLVRPRQDADKNADASPRNLIEPPLSLANPQRQAPTALSLWGEEPEPQPFEREQALNQDLNSGAPFSEPDRTLAIASNERSGPQDELSEVPQSSPQGSVQSKALTRREPQASGDSRLIDSESALTLSDSNSSALSDGHNPAQRQNSQASPQRFKHVLFLALGGVAAVGLIGGAGWGLGRLGEQREPAVIEDTTPLSARDFRESTRLVENAIDAFQGGDETAGNALVEELLDRNVIKGAETALGVLTPNDFTAETNFLLGRLNWQKQVNSPLGSGSFDDAYRYWYFALQDEPQSGRYLTTLGFAAYAKGELEDAQNHWQRATKLLKGAAEPAERRLYLSAKAGLALVQQNQAMQQPLGQQADLLNQAIAGYEFVIAEDFESFSPAVLGRNSATQWLWNQALANEWAELGDRSTTLD